MGPLDPDTVTAFLERHAAKRDLTTERMLKELEADGFWPSGWPLARRLAHQRRVLRGRMSAAGVPHLLLQSDPLPAWITDDHARALLSCLGSDWIDLERVRGQALSINWFPASLEELGQVFALEATVGTERGWRSSRPPGQRGALRGGRVGQREQPDADGDLQTLRGLDHRGCGPDHRARPSSDRGAAGRGAGAPREPVGPLPQSDGEESVARASTERREGSPGAPHPWC